MPGIKGMKTLVATPSRVKHYRTKSTKNREFKLLLNEITIGVHIVNLSVILLGDYIMKNLQMCLTSSPGDTHGK